MKDISDCLEDKLEERMIQEKMKKRRQFENENEENDGSEDRLSELPDGVILHILSFLYTKHVVRTCVLSKRWRHLWKHIPTVILYSSTFSTVRQFAIFVSKILKLRYNSAALHTLDLDRRGDIEDHVIKKILKYVYYHKTHLKELGISVNSDTGLIMNRVSSCHALTSLKLSLSPRGSNHTHDDTPTLFPNSLNLPLLTSLDLTNFAFCRGESDCAEPFLPFTKLNSLFIRSCKLIDTQILTISSATLVNLAMHKNSHDIAKIKLYARSLCTFAFTAGDGDLFPKICGSGLSSVKQANISNSLVFTTSSVEYGLVLLSWLQDLANVESLTVTSLVLQILSLVPDLFKVKLPSLCNLKSLEVVLIPLHHGGPLYRSIKDVMLTIAAAKSHKEVSELRKAFEARLEPLVIPDGIIDFLRQNSRLVEVNMRPYFQGNLKQVDESIKGTEIIKYSSQFSSSASCSTAPSASAESVSAAAPAAAFASAAPPNLYLCPAEKDDKSSNEDKVEKDQLNTDSPLPDND